MHCSYLFETEIWPESFLNAKKLVLSISPHASCTKYTDYSRLTSGSLLAEEPPCTKESECLFASGAGGGLTHT